MRRVKWGDSANNPWNGIQGGSDDSDSRSMEALKLSNGDVGMNGQKGWGMTISRLEKGTDKATLWQKMVTLGQIPEFKN